MLSPITVFEMEPDMVIRIAGETKEYRSLREQLGKKLDILGRGLETCKRFVGIRGISPVAESKHISESNASQRAVQSTTVIAIDEPDESILQSPKINHLNLQDPQLPPVMSPDRVTEIQLTPIESPSHDCNPLTLQEDQDVTNFVPERTQDAEHGFCEDAAAHPAVVDTFDSQSSQSVSSLSMKKSKKGKKLKKKSHASIDMDIAMETESPTRRVNG